MSRALMGGAATIPITPPVGVNLQGYSRKEPCRDVRDPLHAKALVLDDGATRAAIVGVDLVGLEYDSILRIRQRVGSLCDVPPAHVSVAASHTHAGPAVMYLAGDPMDWDYIRTLEREIAGAVVAARQRMRPIRIGYGEGEADFNVNRRVVTPTGTPMLPNPDGPVDRRVRVIRVESDGPEPLAILFQYTCHATVLGGDNNRVSGDYPGAAQRGVERMYSGGTTAIFLQGPTGNVRPHLTSKDGRFRAGSEEDLERIGRSLAGEVVKVAEGIRTRPNPDLAAASSVFRLPYTGLPSERKIRDLSREAGERHRILQPLVLERRRRGHAVLEISGLRIGDLSLVTLPGEVMLEIGQQVEAGLPGRTMVLGYTNGNPGYLCTAASYPQGGYEPTCFFRTYHHPAPFTIDTERILVRTGIRVGRKLRGAA